MQMAEQIAPRSSSADGVQINNQTFEPHAGRPRAYLRSWQMTPDPESGDGIFVTRAGDDIQIIVYDACGHGAPAAGLAASFRRLVAQYPACAIKPSTWRVWNEQLNGIYPAGKMICVQAFELLSTGSIRWWNAAMPLAYRFCARTGLHALVGGGTPLGAGLEGDFVPPDPHEFRPSDGDRVLFCSDGLIEQPAGKAMFGADRVRAVLAEAGRFGDVMLLLHKAFEEFRGKDPLNDDTTVGEITWAHTWPIGTGSSGLTAA